MSWALLILGLALWNAAHFFKRLMPQARASMGNAGKGVVAAVIAVGLVLMVIGYRGTDFVHVYETPSWTVHINNLLMVIAVVLTGAGNSKSRLRDKMRHPMLAGVRVWAIAHLLVNGDLASILLFGGLFIWALLQVIVINRAEPDWTRPDPGTVAGDVRLALISAVVFAVIAGVHTWLGYPVFPT